MNEKMKKWLVIASLMVVGIALVIGIGMRLYKEEVAPVASSAEAQEMEVLAETEEPVSIPTPTPDTELVIEAEEKTDYDKSVQQIQQEPVKTEEEKPKEPPALPEDTDLEDSETIPSYIENIPAVTEAGSGSPQGQNPVHGDTKDGMIYVDGFGWIPNEGGGGDGTIADDMYENGNKIGIMD